MGTTDRTTGRRAAHCLIISAVAFVLTLPCRGSGAVIDFEGLPDGTAVINQYLDTTFSHAIAVQAGAGLNEIDFPPHSGTSAATDDGAAMVVSFSSAIQSFDAFFTYAAPLTLTAFDASNTVLGTVHSLFANNTLLSGENGSKPNEQLNITSPGIRRVQISGLADGNSFVIDDIATTVPEPSVAALICMAAMLSFWSRRISKTGNRAS